MTMAEDFENRALSWWLKQLSLRQIWGLCGTLFVLVAGAASVGFWFGASRQHPVPSEEVVSRPEVKEDAEDRALPDGMTVFEVSLLRILAEPHGNAVRSEYLAFRLNASLLQVETTLEKLERRQLLITVRTEAGDILSAIMTPTGLEYMDDHELFSFELSPDA